jgi:hypothetical protein
VENALHTVNDTVSAHPEYHHYLFAQDDRIGYYEQNPLLRGANTELTFADFLEGKAWRFSARRIRSFVADISF